MNACDIAESEPRSIRTYVVMISLARVIARPIFFIFLGPQSWKSSVQALSILEARFIHCLVTFQALCSVIMTCGSDKTSWGGMTTLRENIERVAIWLSNCQRLKIGHAAEILGLPEVPSDTIRLSTTHIMRNQSTRPSKQAINYQRHNPGIVEV